MAEQSEAVAGEKRKLDEPEPSKPKIPYKRGKKTKVMNSSQFVTAPKLEEMKREPTKVIGVD